MRSTLVMAACALLAGKALARPLDAPTVHALSKLVTQADFEHEFKAFMSTHEHSFKGEEYDMRLGIFTANIARAIEFNKMDPDAQHGVTKFSHLSQDEFKAMYLGQPVDPATVREAMGGIGPALEVKDLPDSFDWRDHGAVTQVKNQGQCGSCWSFSTTGCIEGATMVQTGKLPNLSEQHLVDCDHTCLKDNPQACDSGCNGGLPVNAMEYVQKNGGIDTEASYPYEGFDDTCRADKGTIGATVGNYTIIPTDEVQMAQYMHQYGPVSIGIDALWMQSYMGGVSCPWLCNRNALDHGVLIVAYGKEAISPVRLSEQPFWTIKNSWGPSWGEDGYIRICRGKNMCGLNEMASSVTAI